MVSELTLEDKINLIKSGDNSHWEEIERLCYNLSKRAYKSSWCETKDLSQEIILDLIKRGISKYNSEKAGFKTFLYRLTRNKGIDSIRRDHCLREALKKRIPSDSIGINDEPQKKTEYQRQKLNEALKCLPKTSKSRDVIELYYLRNLSYRQIAEQLNIPLGTVKSTMSRGIERLKKELEPYREDLMGF